ncbi:MAG: alpha/beta fold hydrolase [Gammaproteobacteria bacterium]|nr:alpha/beta fold hydrolase [Gammaproteobacteria bacterium]MBU1415304.1 alpha/beta fold hydrolase [Gammaproteobacteria bacterium]
MKDLVLLAGWGFDSRVWRPVAERLAGEFRIGYELDGASDDAIVCGWSLGAMRAIRFASEKSGVATRHQRLILVGATPRFVQAPGWNCAQPPEVLESFAVGITADPQTALRRFATLLNQGDTRAREITRQLHELMRDGVPDMATLTAGLAELCDANLEKSAVAVRQPTLLIHGERDPLMPLAAAQWLAAHIPDARLEVFAGVAHAPFLSQPDRFAQLVREFAQ